MKINVIGEEIIRYVEGSWFLVQRSCWLALVGGEDVRHLGGHENVGLLKSRSVLGLM